MTACQLSRMSWYISQMPSIRPTLGSHKNRFCLPNKRPSGTKSFYQEGNCQNVRFRT